MEQINKFWIDNQFNYFTILKILELKGNFKVLCKCRCGQELYLTNRQLFESKLLSCGCTKKRVVRKSEFSIRKMYKSEFQAWKDLKQRCLNRNANQFIRYGGRGIKVSSRWRTSFEAFLLNVGPKPSRNYSIDRINNDGNYEPANCKWSTRLEQSRNRGNTVYLLYNESLVPLSEIAEIIGVSYGTLKKRHYRGWEPERIVNEPVLRR